MFSEGSIGHCGHTGQSVFVDLKSGLYTVILSDATISGGGDYSMRIWLNPQKMSALGITVSDIQYALNEQNSQFIVGTLGAPPLKTPQNYQMLLKADNLLTSVEDFENLGADKIKIIR